MPSSSLSTSGAPMSPAWMISETPRRAAIASGRTRPWVSEMTPTTTGPACGARSGTAPLVAPLDRPAMRTGEREHAVVAARPRREPQLEQQLFSRRLQTQPGEWHGARRMRAGFGHRPTQARALVAGEVLDHARVEDDPRRARRVAAELALEPLDRVRAIDRDRHPRRDLERTAQQTPALRLIGPHVRLQRQAAVLRQRIDRRQVAAAPRPDRHGRIERALVAREPVGDANRRRPVAEAAVTALVAEVIPAEIEPGAGSDLEERQRQTRLACDG